MARHVHDRTARPDRSGDAPASAEDAALTRAVRGLGEDLWRPGDGPVSRALGDWLTEHVRPEPPA